jgi:hypothetical protein
MPKKNPSTYREFRALQWHAQGEGKTYDKVDFGNSCMLDGKPLTAVALQPKPILFYKDVWHCPTPKDARRVARNILEFADVKLLELKHTWVYVDFQLPPETDYMLPGQKADSRVNYRGGR